MSQNHTPDPRVELRHHAHDIGRDYLPERWHGLLLSLMDTLPLNEASQVLHLVTEACEHVIAQGMKAEGEIWAKVFAPFPGIALGMRVLYCRVAGSQPACHNYGPGWQCALPLWETPKAG